MENDAPITTAIICDHLGRAKIASAVRVGVTAVSNAAVDNRFPARWFFVVKQLCDEAGIACPASLFSFIPARKTPEGAAQ